MKKTKILTVMGVLLAMGITACGGNNKKSSSSETPVPSSQSSQPAPSSSSQTPSSSSQTPSSSSQTPVPAGDPTGHNWGADADVAASGEGVAYKKASCTDNDGFLKLTINQSQVTYASGSKRKSSTPEGYTKLDGNNQSMSVKFNYDSYAKGKLYLYGCMDGWSSNASKQAFSYNGSPNIEVKVNGTALDIASLSEVIYTDFLSGDASDLSDDGYGYIGDITIHEGVNEISYKRLASMNTLIKDFVLVVKNEEHTHEFTEWAQDKDIVRRHTRHQQLLQKQRALCLWASVRGFRKKLDALCSGGGESHSRRVQILTAILSPIVAGSGVGVPVPVHVGEK